MSKELHFHVLKFLPFPLPTEKGSSAIFDQSCFALTETGDIWGNEIFGGNSLTHSTLFCKGRRWTSRALTTCWRDQVRTCSDRRVLGVNRRWSWWTGDRQIEDLMGGKANGVRVWCSERGRLVRKRRWRRNWVEGIIKRFGWGKESLFTVWSGEERSVVVSGGDEMGDTKGHYLKMEKKKKRESRPHNLIISLMDHVTSTEKRCSLFSMLNTRVS